MGELALKPDKITEEMALCLANAVIEMRQAQKRLMFEHTAATAARFIQARRDIAEIADGIYTEISGP